MRASKILKQLWETENQEFLIYNFKILKTNVEATKRQLEQWKLKKFNYLKYKPQPIKEQTTAITQANFKKTYVNEIINKSPFYYKTNINQ